MFRRARFVVSAGAVCAALLSAPSTVQAGPVSASVLLSQTVTPGGINPTLLEQTLAFFHEGPDDTATISVVAGVGLNPADFAWGDGYYVDFVLTLWNMAFVAPPPTWDVDRVAISLIHADGFVSSDLGFVPSSNEETTSYFDDPPVDSGGPYPMTLEWNNGLLPIAFTVDGAAVFSTRVRLDGLENFPNAFELRYQVEVDTVATPEPAPLGLLGVGVLGAIRARRTRRPPQP